MSESKMINSFTIEGVIFQKLKEQIITSANGTWKKQEFILELSYGTGSKKGHELIKFETFADSAELLSMFSIGDSVEVQFSIRGREWKKDNESVYFTNLSATHIIRKGHASMIHDDLSSSENQFIPQPDDDEPLPF